MSRYQQTAIELAEQLWIKRGVAFSVTVRPFAELTAGEKQIYIGWAQQALETFRPHMNTLTLRASV